jgi:hypothetical protein
MGTVLKGLFLVMGSVALKSKMDGLLSEEIDTKSVLMILGF